MTTLTIEAPAVFKPLDQPSRYKGLWGGRGSGKSWHGDYDCTALSEGAGHSGSLCPRGSEDFPLNS